MPSDPRTYITVHDGMPDHPKIEGLSDGAFRLLVTCWCWCSRNLTNGFMPDTSWLKRGTPKIRRELIEGGLIEPAEGGVRMHDYLEHQRSAEQVAELRAKRAEAGSKGGKAKANALALAKQKLKQNASKPVAESETDTDAASIEAASRARKRATRLPADFVPSEASRSKLITECPEVDLRREHAKFVDYWAAQPGQRGVKVDWDATWRNWMRRAAESTTSRPTRQQQTDDLFARAATRMGVDNPIGETA